jgi:hypothetical protein
VKWNFNLSILKGGLLLNLSTSKYYVYRFINDKGEIVYVGRTRNLHRRFLSHPHLLNDIVKIEYIECGTEAEMVWKEIYYINLFYNKSSTNVSDVYSNKNMKDLHLNDIWLNYDVDFRNTYQLVATKEKYEKFVVNVPKYNYHALIHIIEHEKLNNIGKNEYAISQQWFYKHLEDGGVDKLRKNVINFFKNLTPKGIYNKCFNNSWTTYNEFKNYIKGKGFTKSFIPLGQDSGKNLSDRIYLAYLANNFYPVSNTSNFEISESQYALSEMLQFIWRSAIREGKEIWIYIPSVRMRELLKYWIDKNSN